MSHRIPLLARNTLWYVAIAGGLVFISMLAGFVSDILPSGAKTTIAVRAALSFALQKYQKDCASWPPDLAALATDPGVPGWKGPYYRWRMTDGWRNPFRYRIVNGNPELTSAGPDRQFDTADDLIEAVMPASEQSAQ